MKKVSAFILGFILVFCANPVFAQEMPARESGVVIEGIEETISETRYESENGFALWYPSETFRVYSEYGHETIVPLDETVDDVSLMIVPVDIPVDQAEAFIHEATGGYMPDEAVISEITEWKLDSGLNVKTVQATLAEEIHRFYLITGEESVYCVTAMFPLEALEGYGVRLERIVSTMEAVG